MAFLNVGADPQRLMRRFWSSGSDVRALDGATAVRNRVAPEHPLGTFLRELRTTDVAPLLTVPFRRVLVDAGTPPGDDAVPAALHRPRADFTQGGPSVMSGLGL